MTVSGPRQTRYMSLLRVFELARDLGLPSKDVLGFLAEHGHYVRSASASVPPEAVRLVRQHFPAPSKNQSFRLEAADASGRSSLRDQDLKAQANSIFGDANELKWRRTPEQSRRPSRGKRRPFRDDEQAHWARLLFTREERVAWTKDGVTDAEVANAYRKMGLMPGDLSLVVHGRSGSDWLASGVSAPRLAAVLERYRSGTAER